MGEGRGRGGGEGAWNEAIEEGMQLHEERQADGSKHGTELII